MEDEVIVDEVIEEIEAEEETVIEPESEETEQTEPDEVVVTIGDEQPPEEESRDAKPWVRELRKKRIEDQKRIRELEDELRENKNPEQKAATVGKKPTLEDYDYDAEKFEVELTSWYERKRAADEAETKARADQEAQQKAWNAKLESYGKSKSELKVKDYDDAEAVAQENLSVVQQGILIQGADNPALVIYALGKNPKKSKELAAINDPVKFAFAVAKLETQLKVSNRKSAPPPEKTVSGTGRVSGAVDSNLERLREEAARTGDFTKVAAYKRKNKK
jgi:hypothetical protein